MISLVLVSHSHKITEGLKEMVLEMANNPEKLKVLSAGGTDDNGIGTDPTKIVSAIEESSDCDYIYLIGDIGSGLISIDMALDLLDEELKEKCHVLSGPLVEGAFVTAVNALVDGSPEYIASQIKEVIASF